MHYIILSSSASKLLSQAEVLSMPWEDLKDYAIECGLSAESRALLDYKLSTMSYEEIMDRTYGLYSDIDEVKEVMKSDIEEKVKPIARKKKKRGRSSGSGKFQMCTSCVEKILLYVYVLISCTLSSINLGSKMEPDIEENKKPIARKKRGDTSTGGKYYILCTSYVTFSRLLFTNLNFTNPPQQRRHRLLLTLLVLRDRG